MPNDDYTEVNQTYPTNYNEADFGVTTNDLSGTRDVWDNTAQGNGQLDSATSGDALESGFIPSSVIQDSFNAGTLAEKETSLESMLGKKAADLLKKTYTNASGEFDWSKIGAAAAVAYALKNRTNTTPTGYQGGIPNLVAQRTAMNYKDPNRVAGSAGRQYFSDQQYSDVTDPTKVAAAKTANQEQAAGIASGYNFAPTTSREDVYNAYASTPGAIKNPSQSSVDYWQTHGLAGFKGAVDAYHAANPTPAATPILPAATVNNTARMPWEKAVVATGPNPAPTTAAEHLAVPKAEDLAMNQQHLAHGGIAGRYLQGATDGMADKLHASIDNKQPAKLSHGEFVIPADVVSHLGNGNSEAGANKLYDMMAKVRKARTGNSEQGKEIDPDKFMPGGHVPGYAGTTDGSLVNAGATGKQESLSDWAGPYVTDVLGKGQALANQPYQAYQGPLTAGASDLQSQAFAGIGGLTVPSAMGQATQTAGDVANKAGQMTYTPNSSTFDTAAANQYMNPYIQSALNPQLAEMKRQADISRMGDASRLTQAGAFGGSRQAIMESEGNRNLLTAQTGAIGTGYANAYDKAMQQFNADQARGEGSRQFGANYGMQGLKTQLDAATTQSQLGNAEQNAGLANLNAQLSAGNMQRGITSEGIAADKKQFEEERDDPYKKVLFQQSLLQGLPIAAQSYTTTPQSATQAASGAISDVAALAQKLKDLGIAV